MCNNIRVFAVLHTVLEFTAHFYGQAHTDIVRASSETVEAQRSFQYGKNYLYRIQLLPGQHIQWTMNDLWTIPPPKKNTIDTIQPLK